MFFHFSFYVLRPLHGQKIPAGKYLVVLDPGHGGIDKGVRISGDVHESDITLASPSSSGIRSRKSRLSARITRTGDDAPLADRIKIANDKSTDVFISIHVNAGFDKEAAGYELYFPGFNALPNVRKRFRGYRERHGENPEPQRERQARPHCPEKPGDRLPRKDRGLREAPIRIQASIPALVIELGFASNPDEKKQITSRETAEKASTALAASVREFASTGKKNAP